MKPTSTLQAGLDVLGLILFGIALWLLPPVPPLQLFLVIAGMAAGMAVAWTLFKGARTRSLAGALLGIALGGWSLFLVNFEQLGFLLMMIPVAGLWWGLDMVSSRRLWKLARMVPPLAVLIYGASVGGLFAVGAPRMGFPPLTPDGWFAVYRSPEGFALDAEEQQAAIDLVRAVLDGRDPSSMPRPGALGQSFSRDAWVTLYRRGSAGSLRGSAGGAPLGELLVEATREALGSQTRLPRALIQIDLEQRPRALANARVAVLAWQIEPGIDGVRLRKGDEQVQFLPSDPVTRGWLTPRRRYRTEKIEQLFARLEGQADIERGSWIEQGWTLEKFRTFSFAEPIIGQPPRETYRGNVLLDPAETTTEEGILASIDTAGTWLLNTVKEDGTFDYEYFPNQDRSSDDYNWVRHAGSVYGLFYMYNLASSEPSLEADKDRYLEAGLQALEGVYSRLENPSGGPPGSTLYALPDARGRFDSGSQALTLLTFLERPLPEDVDNPELRARLTRPEDDAIIEGLATMLTGFIDDRGWVFARWNQAQSMRRVCDVEDDCSDGQDNDGDGDIDCRDSDCERSSECESETICDDRIDNDQDGRRDCRDPDCLGDEACAGRRRPRPCREPLYYPGEAMLALARLHKRTGDPRWLDAAEAIGRSQIDRWMARPRMNPDHWVMQANFKLYEITGDEYWADGGIAMGDRYASEQYPPQQGFFDDYYGAYRRTNDLPRTTRAASRGEALGGVVHIAWARGDDPTPYEDALLAGAHHMAEQIWRPENSWFLPNPARAEGALRMGLVDMHCRIDNNQHALVSFGYALEAVRRRAER